MTYGGIPWDIPIANQLGDAISPKSTNIHSMNM